VITVTAGNDFARWREAARDLVASGVLPSEVSWSACEQRGLLAVPATNRASKSITVPAEFIRLGETVACYDDQRKWPLLYNILYRLVYENRDLLKIESDMDIREARLMEKAVRRDIHKFHAFVRFRPVVCSGVEVYNAWHEPAHFIVERATPFFVRRFGPMRFSILTPKGCAHWDLDELRFTAGIAKGPALDADEAEDFWLTYYRSIFNPFRLNLTAMKTEMPVRHWRTMPETRLIKELIREAAEE
jgi:uracil-DNA glycosylase